jgi:hypothetical protein
MQNKNEQTFSENQNEQIDKALQIIASKHTPDMTISYPASSPLDVNTNISITQPFNPTSVYNPERYGIGLPPALWPKDAPEGIGFFRAFAREAADMTMPGEIYQAYVKKKAFEPVDNSNLQNVLSQPIPNNWMPTDNKEMLKSVPSKYRDSLINGVTSPQQQQNIYNWIQDQITREEQWNNQPYLQKWATGLAGGAAGLAADWFMFKWLAPFKYAALDYNFIQRTGLEAGNLLGYSFTREGLTGIVDPERKIEDIGYNTLVDTAAGLAFYGGFEGLSTAGKKLKLGERISELIDFSAGAMHQAKDANKYNLEGIEARFNLSEKGEVEGMTAAPIGNYAQSAQKISDAKMFYESQMAKKGLFWFPQTYRSPITGFFGLWDNTIEGLTGDGPLPAITNAIVHHNIETIAGKKYIPNGLAFDAEMQGVDGEIKRAQAQLEGYRLRYNGMDLTLPEEQQLKQFSEKLDKNDYQNPASFGTRVYNNLLTFGADTNPEIRDATALWKSSTEPHYKRYLASQNLDETIFPQRVYEGYVTRAYNRLAIRNDRQGFINATVQAFTDQDAMIRKWTEPLDALVNTRKQLTDKITSNTNVIANQNALAEVNAKISKYRKQIHKAQLDDPNLKILLDDYTTLSSEDVTGLTKFLKKREELKSQISDFTTQIEDLNKKEFLLKSKITAKKPKNLSEEVHLAKVKKLNAERDALLSDIESIKAQREPIRTQLSDEELKLRYSVFEGKVPRNWYFFNAEDKLTFKDPGDLPKFRQLFQDANEMEEEAARYYDSIMGYTDDDLATIALNTISNPQSTKGRRLLVNSSYYLNNGFLDTNLPKMLENYVRPLAKNYLLDEKLENFTGVTKKGLDGYLQVITNYYQEQRALAEQLPEKQRKKRLDQIDKLEQSGKEFTENLINGYVGIKPDKLNAAMYEIGKNARLLAVSTRLGNTALSQLGDSAGSIFKFGPFQWIRAGLTPSVASLNGLLKTKQGARLREYARQAGLGLEHMNKSQFRQAYDGSLVDSSTPSNMVTSALEGLAHFSQKIGLVHFLENWNQKMAASTAQHQFIRLLNKYAIGKNLSKNDRLFLETYGLKPEEWADSVMEQFKQYGEKSIYGFQSDYFKWTDTKVQQRFSQAVYNSVKDAIIQGRQTDLPFIKVPLINKYINLQNPAHQIGTQFLSWSFAALHKYAVPFMQQLQGKQFAAILIMAAMAAQQTIFRKISRGEEVDMDSDELLKEAFANSGATSLLYKSAQWANAIVGGDVEFLKNDKSRNTTQLGMLGGPAVGVAESIGNVLAMMGQRAWNKKDIEKGVRAIPVINQFYTYQLIQDGLDKLTDGLPATRAQAQRTKE